MSCSKNIDKNSVALDTSLTRNLTTLFGFFFVLLSSIFVAVSLLSTSDIIIRTVVYFMAVIMGVSASMVGIELYCHFKRDGLQSVGRWGISCLVLIFPFMFVIAVGVLLYLPIESIALGLVVYIISLVLPPVIDFYSKID